MNKSGSPAVSSAAFVNMADQILQMNRMITLFHFISWFEKNWEQGLKIGLFESKLLKNVNIFFLKLFKKHNIFCLKRFSTRLIKNQVWVLEKNWTC